MDTVNYSEFRANLKHWLDKVINNMGDVIPKRKGGKDLVLISLDEYNSLKESTCLLTGRNRDNLPISVSQMEAGEGILKRPFRSIYYLIKS